MALPPERLRNFSRSRHRPVPNRQATRTYELVVSHQTAEAGHCDYEVREFPAGLMRLGTIHIHAGIDAFHSWRDSANERFEFSFHLTIGNVDTGLTLSCSVVV